MSNSNPLMNTMKAAPSNQYPSNASGINTRDLVSKIIRQWPWFVVCGLIGLLAGVLVNQYAKSRYEISSTMLLKTEKEKASMTSIFSEQQMPANLINAIDQVGIVQSYRLNLKTINNLDWKVSWYERGFLDQTDLYMQEPFVVTETGSQVKMVPVHIKPVSKDTYHVEVDAELNRGGRLQTIKLDKVVRYGEPFSNEYFNFTLDKKSEFVNVDGREYIMVFNDFSQLARQYKERLQVSLGEENSNLIYVKLVSTQLLRDINYLNELGNIYIDFGLEEKNKIADNTLRFINNQLIGVTDSLQTASKDFTNFRSRNKIVDLGQEASMVVTNLEEIEREESAARMRLEYYTNLKGYLSDASQMKDLIAPSVVGITDASLNAMVMKLTDLYSQRELLSYSVQEKNPDLMTLDNTIQYTQKILTENINNLLNNTNIELRNVGQRKQKVSALLSRLPKTEQDLINIKRSFDLNNDLYTFLLRKRAEVGIARASNNPDATVLDTARFDAAVYLGPNKIANILIGLVLGLGLPLVTLLLVDYFDSRLKNADAVESNSALAVAGYIYTNKFKSEIPVVQYPNSSITESFRTLRANLYYLMSDPSRKIIAVHSPMVGEGKSFIAINLVAALALNNKNVLLVETDMRRPRLYLALKLNRETGLSTYLSGKSAFEQIVQPTKIKGLSFVASGAATRNNAELLNSKLFTRFIEEARAQFDLVILDSVPTDILSDAITIGRQADINLMVLRFNYSTQDQLKSVNKIAHEGAMENMVLVLNDVSDEKARKQLKKYGYQ